MRSCKLVQNVNSFRRVGRIVGVGAEFLQSSIYVSERCRFTILESLLFYAMAIATARYQDAWLFGSHTPAFAQRHNRRLHRGHLMSDMDGEG